MRGLVPGLVNPHPLGRGLPGVYQEEDHLAMRLTEAFDTILAPVISTLDNLPAYLDPQFTPEDFLGWLSGWVAFDLDETWDLSVRRVAVARAVDLLRRRGTASGLADEVELITGAKVEVVENGGTAWSLDASSQMVGSPKPALVVRIEAAEPSTIDVERIDRIVAAAKPAHVPHRIVVSRPDGGRKARRGRGSGPPSPSAPATSRESAAAGETPEGEGADADSAAEDAGSSPSES